MEFRQIAEDFAVSAQIAPSEVEAIRQAGFRSIICNRPDDEQPGQPSAASVRAAAEAAGLEFHFVPVVSGQITRDNVADMADALGDAARPVFAYCRSGARCTNLFALVEQFKAHP